MCHQLTKCEPALAERSFVTFDPPNRQLGSGGGTAYVLEQAWKKSGESSFASWLNKSGKLIIHGGGESRRLPAYAAPGKLFIPIPVFRWSVGQRLDQTLLTLSEPILQKIAASAPKTSRVMVASGDVLILLDGSVPPIPNADVVFLGMWMKPEDAQKFGVMFTPTDDPEKLVTFLQKPHPDMIRKMGQDHTFLVDIGIWLLSEKAVECLMKKCGWVEDQKGFAGGQPLTYDLYGQWALNLGEEPTLYDPELSKLKTAIVPLSNAGFYHFGSSSDMLQSLYDIQNIVMDQTKLGFVPTAAQPRQFLQNAVFEAPLRREENHSIWVENSHIPDTWKLTSRNIMTGVPENDWDLVLEEGICLDFVPVHDQIVIRVYGYSDNFRGELSSNQTFWLEKPFQEWLVNRNISINEIGVEGATDIQAAPLFPLVNNLEPEFVKWMFSSTPEESAAFKDLWLKCNRLSARQLTHEANLISIYDSRKEWRNRIIPVLAAHGSRSVFYKLDLEATAQIYSGSDRLLPQKPSIDSFRNPLDALHDRMFRANVCRQNGDNRWVNMEAESFEILRDLIVERYKRRPIEPSNTLLNDQIVWGRCPVRLDMAGGWADTPPYCLEYGGTVTNVAVNLNGQPPIQVFARKTRENILTVRSIDLGLSEQLQTFDDVAEYGSVGSGFSLARAAFAIAGFHPDFGGTRFKTLAELLNSIGGGIEISMIAATPKGSGLGTSSILAATILGVLSDLAGYGWDKFEISRRTLALEQLLTSGGGWQDQVGGLFPGIKLIKTRSGLSQDPDIRWLPDRFFHGSEKSRMLLYYTGITRIAHHILSDIVRGIFLNSNERLKTIDAIAENAIFCHDSIQRNDFNGFSESVKRSWDLNQRLDSGTNPPEVEDLLYRIRDRLQAAKLLGAGGGGYLFLIAKDSESAESIKIELENEPPNEGARFVEMDLSETGLQVTRS